MFDADRYSVCGFNGSSDSFTNDNPGADTPGGCEGISRYSFEIAGNMTRTECDDVSWLHGLVHDFIKKIGHFSSLKNPGVDSGISSMNN